MKNQIKINVIDNNIFHITSKNLVDLGLTFFRIQEFYESPYKELNGKYFTLEKGLEIYHKKNPNTTSYFHFWQGFNIPGHILNDFIQKYYSYLIEHKHDLILHTVWINSLQKKLKKFYIIGTLEKDTDIIKHELAHAFWYLDKSYKKDMKNLIKNCPQEMIVQIRKNLKNKGYCAKVLDDETQAYCATGGYHIIPSKYKKAKYIKEFNRIFEEKYKKVK